MDNLYLATFDEIPHLLRWVELSVQQGCMSEETATEWRIRIEAWREWASQHTAMVRPCWDDFTSSALRHLGAARTAEPAIRP